MFLLYLLYIVLMYFNHPLSNYFIHKVNVWKESNTVMRKISTYHGNMREEERQPLLLDTNEKLDQEESSIEDKLGASGASSKSYGTQHSDLEKTFGSGLSEREKQELQQEKGLKRSNSQKKSGEGISFSMC